MITKIRLAQPVKRVRLEYNYIPPTDSFSSDEIDEEWNAENPKNEKELIQMLRNQIKSLEDSLQTAREEAFQLGFEEGQKAVEKKYLELMEQLPRQLAITINNLQNQYREAIEKLDEPILKLSLKLVEKILKRNLEIEENQKEFLINQIKYFLDQLKEPELVTIHISPNQMQFVKHQNFLKNLNYKINFVENPQLVPGECLVETEDFMIDGTIDGQLEQVARQLINEK